MRILVLALDFPTEDRPHVGIWTLRQAEALRSMGHDLSVLRIVPHAPPFGSKWRSYRAVPESYTMNGIPVRTIRAVFPPRTIAMEFLPLQVHSRVRDEIASVAPDLLHANYLIPCGQIAVRHSLPTVVTAHGGDAYIWPQLRPGLTRAAREAIIKATKLTAVSNYIRECVQAIEPRDVEVIPNGADEYLFYPRESLPARASLGLPQHRLIVAFVGHIFERKGIFDLIEAAAGMRDLNPLIAMAGQGQHEAEVRERSHRAGVETRLLGRLDGDDVAKLYCAADIFALPSYNEGLPNVVCEAMLAGRPVVATHVGGIPDIVRDGVTGVLVAPSDVAQLRAALTRVALDPRLRDALGARAREYARAHLTWRINAEAYERVYAAALSAPQSAPSNSRRRSLHAWW